MTQALLYHSRHKWRFGAALGAAAVIHLAAVGFANNYSPAPSGPPSFPGDPTEITFEPADPIPDPPTDLPDPLPTPPPNEQLFQEDNATPPPVRTQTKKFTPVTKPRGNTLPGSVRGSSPRVFALNSPRPEYPYEARRQKITGDGIVAMTVDPATGNVTSVSMLKTTGSPFLDNAATAGFKRWRFKPGGVSSVTCPVTFTLTGVSY